MGQTDTMDSDTLLPSSWIPAAFRGFALAIPALLGLERGRSVSIYKYYRMKALCLHRYGYFSAGISLFLDTGSYAATSLEEAILLRAFIYLFQSLFCGIYI